MKKFTTFLKAFRCIFAYSPFTTFLLLIFTVLEGCIPALLALIMKNIVDLVTTTRENLADGFVTLIILWIVGMMVQQGIATILRITIDTYNVKTSKRIGNTIIEKRLSLASVSIFEDMDFLKTYERISNSPYLIENFVNNFRYWFKSVVEFVSIFLLFLSFEVWVPIAILISVIPGFFTAKKIAKIQLDEEDTLYGIEREASYYRNVLMQSQAAREIRLFNFGELFSKKFIDASNRHIKFNNKFRRKIAMYDFIGTAIRIIAVAMIMYLLSMRALSGNISVGLLAMFLQSVFSFSTAMLTIIEYWAYQDSALAFFERFFKFMGMKDVLVKSKNPKPFSGVIESIQFKNVSFSYNQEVQVLKNISFELNAKEIFAIVGENGAGKSTLVKLLARFYDPNSGSILVNGIDIHEYDIEQYQKAISAVFQDYGKYYVTVAENILLDGKLQEHQHLVDATGIHFITELPEKENALIGTYFGGTDLSGGQWQRIAIARALNKEHSLLLVDEPTASIDPIQEREIYEMLLNDTERLTILVTHRLGSIRKANKILVLKEGELVAVGTHENLMKASNYYNELYSSQADMYIEK